MWTNTRFLNVGARCAWTEWKGAKGAQLGNEEGGGRVGMIQLARHAVSCMGMHVYKTNIIRQFLFIGPSESKQ